MNLNLAKLSIKRPTFITALLMVIIILGLAAYGRMSVRMFPDIEFPYVLVMTQYSGAGPEEIEQLVSKPLEDAMSGISGLKHVNSISQDNYSIVYGEFELSKDPDIALQEVKDKVGEAKRNLPGDIEEPVIQKLDPDGMPIVSLSLKANMTSKELYDFANDEITKEISRVSGVSKVEILGGCKREIHVDIDKNKLKAHELTLSAVSARIKSNSLNIPAGKVNKGAMDLAFRTIGEFKSIKQINDVVVSFMGNDIAVTVKDLGKVVDSFEEETTRARVSIRDENGNIDIEPSLIIQVYKQAKSNDVAISDAVRKRLIEVNEKYKDEPGKPVLTLIADNAKSVRMNLKDVERTIIEGIFLAVVVVYFFLGSWRSTFITSLALPNSLIGAFLFMNLFGFSLNVLSLMSLSLAVGLLIDDAIVVRENIFRHYEEGSSPVKSALDGTNEVTMAVIATTSAVVAVFLPVSFLSGIMGRFFKEFGLTVVFAMFISVLDALTIAPMLSAYIIKGHDEEKEQGKIIKAVSMIWNYLTLRWFEKIYKACERFYIFAVKKAVKHKILTILCAVLFFAGSLGVAKQLNFTFMPTAEWGEFTISLEAEPGTSLEQMDKVTKTAEDIILSDPNIEMLVTAVGSTTGLSNKSSIDVKLISSDKRTVTTNDMKDKFRKELNEKYGREYQDNNVHVSIGNSTMNGAGRSEFIVELFGADASQMSAAASVLMERYKGIPGLVDINTNYRSGKPELQIRMDTKKMESLGVNSVVTGNEVRAMIDGVKSGKFREKGTEYDIRVQLRQDQKDIMEAFNSTYINNVNGKLVKLTNVAFPVKAEGPATINRKDRSQFVTVEGNLEKGGAIGSIRKEAIRIFNEEKAKPENSRIWKHIEIRFSGNADEMNTMVQGIILAAAMSVLFMYLILMSLYESVITPLTIMSALPLAIIGGFVALYLTGQSIDMFTLIGMIMLLGIVAKNSILLVDYTQQKIRAGDSVDDAVVTAGQTRFRPILMTTFAVIAGMLPTALGLTEVGAFRKGMGIVVIGGVISSTLLTLLVVPAIFGYMDRFRRFTRKLIGRPERRMIDHSDAELADEELL